MANNTWDYADYISLDDPSARLDRLRLHITEVSQRTIGIEGRSSNVSAVNPTYLKNLKEEESKLTERVNASQYGSFRRNTIEFRRD